MSDIFVSYASEDRERIMPLVRALEEKGWSVFWDRTIPIGKTWREVIGNEVRSCRSMIVVWSGKSVESEYVQEEAEEGKKRRILFPVLIDDVPLPFGFSGRQAANIVGWDGASEAHEFGRLITDLTAFLGAPPTAEASKWEAEEERKRVEEDKRRVEEEAKQKAQEERKKAEVPTRKVAEEVRFKVPAWAIAGVVGMLLVVVYYIRTLETLTPSLLRIPEREVIQKPTQVTPQKQPVPKTPATEAVSTPAPKKKPLPMPSAPAVVPQPSPKDAAPITTATSATWKEPYTGIEFVLVPGGCYEMGDTFGNGDADERPVHRVCLDDFYLAWHEVTQKQWQKVMGSNPSKFKGCDDCPVEQVSWEEARTFIEKLNSQTGTKLRLPTEAEWEYAARSGGKKEKWAGTNSVSSLKDYAWLSVNAEGHAHQVGALRPNGIGLYDMTGNVSEWVNDWYEDKFYSKSPKKNPQGPISGKDRVHRGGSWGNYREYARCAYRDSDIPDSRGSLIGFRCARIK